MIEREQRFGLEFGAGLGKCTVANGLQRRTRSLNGLEEGIQAGLDAGIDALHEECDQDRERQTALAGEISTRNAALCQELGIMNALNEKRKEFFVSFKKGLRQVPWKVASIK